jgi:hypothetical protein
MELVIVMVMFKMIVVYVMVMEQCMSVAVLILKKDFVIVMAM